MMASFRAIGVPSLFVALFALLSSNPSSAATTVYNVVGNGLGFDDGHACLSTEAPGDCATNATFGVPGTYPISGTITVDDVALTADIDITLASGTMTGAYDGVDEIVFSNVNYTATYPVAIVGNQVFGAGAPTGSVGGVGATYEQLSGGGNVAGPTGFTESSIFSAFTCGGLDGVGLCGLTVGGSRDFALNVGATGGGASTDFVHTFNFNVEAPEPSAALLIPLGLVSLAASRRRRS